MQRLHDYRMLYTRCSPKPLPYWQIGCTTLGTNPIVPNPQPVKCQSDERNEIGERAIPMQLRELRIQLLHFRRRL